MQPSDLDTKIQPLSPSKAYQNHRVLTSGINNHLNAVPNSSSPSFAHEKPAGDSIHKKSWTPEIVKNIDNNGVNLDRPLNNGTHAANSGGGTQDQDSGNGNAGVVEEQGFLPVLRNFNFLALWGGQIFCQLADKVYLVLMIALINTQFQSSEQSISGWVSVLMIAFTIPAVLFGSVAGVFVDRWSKKAVLVATNLWRGILVLAIPVLLWLTHDWQPVGVLPMGFGIILVVTFLVSTLTQFFAPAEQAAIPLIVKEQHLLSANSLYTTTMMASVIIGFAVGEPLLAIADQLWQNLGGSGSLGKELIVGGSYAVAGIILLLLATNEKPHMPEQESPHPIADLRDGLRYLQENIRLRNALLQLIILFSVFAALTVLAVRMAEIIPNLKASQFGFLLAAGGVGIAIGATILGQFCQRLSYTQLSLYGNIGVLVSLIGLSVFTKQLWIVLLLVMLVGVFGALVGIPMQTAIQTETPPAMRGKVFGLQNNVINIALTLPLALTGVAENFLGLQTVFLGLAAIVFFGGVLTWYNSAHQ
ncbi:MFS transporter [Iningainema sp. BLCCT55]|uniref:MFS transporter n=2 Tax=Iningainema TaxID=1932705 RepID=A0A8J6Y073_9CYAN|nr:MFS transporter [Iningainema tapete]MBD2776623.1 MFS transporter [Iningainema tapete BLCC-T55]